MKSTEENHQTSSSRKYEETDCTNRTDWPNLRFKPSTISLLSLYCSWQFLANVHLMKCNCHIYTPLQNVESGNTTASDPIPWVVMTSWVRTSWVMITVSRWGDEGFDNSKLQCSPLTDTPNLEDVWQSVSGSFDESWYAVEMLRLDGVELLAVHVVHK